MDFYLFLQVILCFLKGRRCGSKETKDSCACDLNHMFSFQTQIQEGACYYRSIFSLGVMTPLSNLLLQLLCDDTRQAWDLEPFASVLQNLHLDKPLLEQQNTKKLYWTKNNNLHAQLGQILDTKETKKPKSQTANFEKPGAGFWG